MTQPTIPIENIYYLFCYAWDRFEEAQAINVGGVPSPDLPNLLARVLLSGTRALLRRGLDRGYKPYEDEIATVRGRIDLGGTIALQGRNIRRLHCEFDDLSHDLHHNRVLKASLKRLARGSMIERSLSHDLQAIARRMRDVTDIWLEKTAFARVQLHRNNAYYDLLIKVAELAFDCLLPTPSGSGFAFNDVTRDERKMAGVFEAFVRNFYRFEQNEFVVAPLTIAWDGVRIGGETSRLPRMIVDIYLRSDNRRIIIDTKYYANALQSRDGSESFHSGNLYQLFAYLKNVSGQDRSFAQVEGMLLYPCVGVALDETFLIQGHPIKVATVDLAQPWSAIRAQLLAHVNA